MGYTPEYGARPIRRAINEHIVNGITMKLLSAELRGDAPIRVTAENGDFVFENELPSEEEQTVS